MPTYDVIAPGFHEGKLYDPEGKRKTLSVDKPFKKCPSWLKPQKDVIKVSTKAGPSAQDMKNELDALGVEYKGNASKEVLTELLEANKGGSKETVDFSAEPSSNIVESL